MQEYRRGKLGICFLNSAAKTSSYGLKTCKALKSNMPLVLKHIFIHLTLLTQAD